MCIKKDDKGDIGISIADFSGFYSDLEPFMTPDNLRLYFVSNRPLSNKENETKDFDIWYVERKSVDNNWGEPVNIGAPVNTELDEFYPSLSSNYNLYFTSYKNGTKGVDDIFVSYYKNGKYTEPESLPEAINSSGYEFNAYISPDESFLIYTAYQRENSYGSGDLYISFKN